MLISRDFKCVHYTRQFLQTYPACHSWLGGLTVQIKKPRQVAEAIRDPELFESGYIIVVNNG